MLFRSIMASKDSAVCSLVAPKEGFNTSGVLQYSLPGNTTITPNGLISFTPTSPGMYDFCIKITQYRNGVEVGYELFEFPWTVLLSNSIDEIITNAGDNSNYQYFDILGRNIQNNYNGIKLRKQ